MIEKKATHGPTVNRFFCSRVKPDTVIGLDVHGAPSPEAVNSLEAATCTLEAVKKVNFFAMFFPSAF